MRAASSIARCGADRKQDKDDDKTDGSSPETPTGEVPPSWDGQADWDQSPFEVVEE